MSWVLTTENTRDTTLEASTACLWLTYCGRIFNLPCHDWPICRVNFGQFLGASRLLLRGLQLSGSMSQIMSCSYSCDVSGVSGAVKSPIWFDAIKPCEPVKSIICAGQLPWVFLYGNWPFLFFFRAEKLGGDLQERDHNAKEIRQRDSTIGGLAMVKPFGDPPQTVALFKWAMGIPYTI